MSLRNVGRALFAGILSVTAARAQVLPKLAVLPLPGDAGRSATEAVAGEFRKSQRVFVVDSAEIQGYMRNQQGGGAAGGVEAAEKKLKAGEEAYAKLRIKPAIDLLQEAKILFRQNLRSAKAFDGLRSAQFYLAMAFQAQKQDERAKDELRQAYVLDPERGTRKLSEKLFPPSIRALHAAVRKEFAGKPTGDLEVLSFPPGAVAYVDGKSVGMTPATVRGLPVGEHFIRVAPDGGTESLGSKYVIAGPNRFEPDVNVAVPQNIFQYFEPIDPPTDLAAPRAAFLDSMGVSLGAEVMVFLSPGNQEVKGQLYDQRSQALSSPVSERSPDLLVAKLLRFVGEDGYVVAAPKPVDPAFAEAPRDPDAAVNLRPSGRSENSEELVRQARRSNSEGIFSGRKKWWWIGGGAAVVVGAGAYFLLRGLSSGGADNSVLNVDIP